VIRHDFFRSRLSPPVIVVVLIILQPIYVVRQHRPIAWRKTIVIGGFAKRIDDVVQETVIPAAVVQIRLHFRQFLFGSLNPLAFPVGRAVRAPDVIQIGSNLHENFGSPTLASKALFALVIPVLSHDGRRERRHHHPRYKNPFHADFSSSYGSQTWFGSFVQ
jgi:hypothetical protein